MAAHQAPPSLGFSRQEHWSGLPFPSPMHESEKWKWSRSVTSDSPQPHGLQPTRLLRPWDFPGKCTGVGCHCQKASPKAVLTYFKWAPQWMIYPRKSEKRKGEWEENKTFISIYCTVLWSRSVVSDSWRPHGLQPTRLLRPWDFPGKNTGVGYHFLHSKSHFFPSSTVI